MKELMEKWRQRIKSVSRTIIHSILINYANTKVVRASIIQNPLDDENKKIQTVINTYDENKQRFKFYVRNQQDVTEICIYEKEMSKNNSKRSITIEEKNVIKFLDKNKIESYEIAIVEFLLGNIEWK